MRKTMDAALRARGGRRRRPRRLAPRHRLRGGLERAVPALRAGARALLGRRRGSCSRTRPARAARSAARSTSSRCSSTRSTGTSGSGICLDTCHLWVSGVDVTDPAASTRRSPRSTTRIGLDRLRALHVNDAADAARLQPRPPRLDRQGRSSATGMGAFLAHPKLQGLPAVARDAGPGRARPGPTELRRVRSLHRRALEPRA